jgi:pentatricopeptide repeat protein
VDALKDLVSWNTMIVGYAQAEHMDEALRIFEEMGERNIFHGII